MDITALYHPDAIYSLTVPPCDSTTLYPGFDENFISRILGRKIWVRGGSIKVPSMLNAVNLMNTHQLFFSVRSIDEVLTINSYRQTYREKYTDTY